MFNKIMNRVKADAVKNYAANIVDQINEEVGKRVSFSKMNDTMNVFGEERESKPAQNWSRAMIR